MGFQNGSVRLFRVAGIDVFLHWSWVLVALYQVTVERSEDMEYTPDHRLLWRTVEYLSLFGIVLLHEFGHALACRQVGGVANRIMLWPLGGVAYVSPPVRPGAVLWSIAAGPLVNVALVPLTLGCWFFSKALGWPGVLPDLHHFIQTMMIVNFVLLAFNLLPIYPLDGGQIVQSLLWFVIGRAQSLMVAGVLGMLGGGLLLLLGVALSFAGLNLGVAVLCLMAAFIALRSWVGLTQGRALQQLEQARRHRGLACPNCGKAPPKGDFWVCERCKTRFDTFEAGGQCPNCGKVFNETMCPFCYQRHNIALWYPAVLSAEEASEYPV